VIKWIKHIISEYLLSALLAIVLVFIMNQFIIISLISGSSMYPTILNGDIAIFSKINLDEIKEGDIVALRHNDEYLVKRVIALDGDKVRIVEDGILVNGEKIIDETQELRIYMSELDYSLGDGEIFVVGDNSIVSYDSRMFGPVSKTSVLGKYVFRFSLSSLIR